MTLSHNYFVYIMTNKHKNVVYTGVTNDLERRVCEHESSETKDSQKSTIVIIWFIMSISPILIMK